ncbi:MAG: glycosyltransferase family 39 protein [Ilumatobacteraceae bacterium]|nr:glycosyltransferase family 39 protein [Ilumatobacteraceae bacterium]
MSESSVAVRGDRAWVSTLTSAALALTLGAMAAAMFASHRSGHWWGDDWALYIRQAKGLLDGDAGRVIDENRFTVEMSRGAAFSPPLYPWGFPIILAPFVAVVGADVDRLAIVPVLCSMVFAVGWYTLAKRRLGALPALVGVVAVTLTPLLVGWTELIQSEWPFLATTAVVLVGLDRLAEAGALTDRAAPLWPVLLVGFGAAAAFSVRREGLAVVGAIAVAQFVGLATDRGWWHDRSMWTTLAARLLAPHTMALAVVGVLQVVLPSTLVPQYSGTSVANVWRFRRDHVDHLAEVSGLKRSWQDAPDVLGSTTLGWVAVVAYLTAATAGIVLAAVCFRRRDLHLVAYVVGALLIGGSFRSPINRYVCTIAPILLLLGAVAVVSAARFVPWRHAGTAIVTVVLALPAIGNVVQADTRIDQAERVAATGAIEWGPTHPLAIEMFEEVIERTDPGAVIAAPKARAMTLETGRLSVQVDDYRPIPDTLPLDLVVVEHDSDLAAELAAADVADADDRPRFHRVWTNARFAIYAPAITAG